MLVCQHKQNAISAEIVHRSPDHSVLEQTNVGLVQFVGFFALAVVQRHLARTINRNQVLLGFVVGVLPAGHIGLGSVDVENPFDVKWDIDT